jgi:integrase
MGVKIREKVKGSGVWWMFVHHKGVRMSMLIGAEEAAGIAQIDMQGRIGRGLDIAAEKKKLEKPAPKVTLEQYYRKFENTYLQTACRESTAERYDDCFRLYLLPKFGALPLEEINREQIKELIAELVRKGLARPTIRIILANLSTVFNHAIEDKILTYNPAGKVSRFYKQAKIMHEEIEPLTADEVPIFLNVARALDSGKRYEKAAEYYPFFLCAIHTGMRAGELAGLQWPDIDWNGKFIMVRRSVRGDRMYPTKTNKSRKVDMSDDLAAELLELRRRRKEAYLADGKNEIPEYVFCDSNGGLIDINNMRKRHFNKCLEKAKLRRIRFHDLRHTFASLLLQNGESPQYVKEQLGHSSIRITVDIYGHLIPGANRQAVNRLPSDRTEKANAESKAI